MSCKIETRKFTNGAGVYIWFSPSGDMVVEVKDIAAEADIFPDSGTLAHGLDNSENLRLFRQFIDDEIQRRKPGRELPEGLPPLPDGAVYLGAGLSFEVRGRFAGWSFLPLESGSLSGWLRGGQWEGVYPDRHYAAPADSEIARLNGLGGEVSE